MSSVRVVVLKRCVGSLLVSLRCVPLDFPSLETRVLFLGLVRMLFVRVCSVLSVPWPVFIGTAQGREMTYA
jgi:hypothetical protein